ncbi:MULTISPECIES: helix-turn-helix transcriptional regulator [Variovorax]|uniref:helix-turn-helix transcriptional regulator n=1 Tax=Variovorax TaxID=34072 RepID=UPI002855FCD5|nr:LuxR C-terminal-related transcriptional regulator [Variovorax sp. 3319]MDR6885667.1 DNA-binding CsgD family transcriptional regulator [Variovorax sp. 3319]
MRTWIPDLPAESLGSSLAQRLPMVVPALGEPGFGACLLDAMASALPVGSFSVYRTGSRPAIFLSGSRGMPDTTRDCWHAYLSGPIRSDRTLREASVPQLRVCHITAPEVPAEHRAKVYDAHGVMERVSVVEEEPAAYDDNALFAVNFYRHTHQRPLSDAQLADFGIAGRLLMALARKHIALTRADAANEPGARLLARCPALTTQELNVCLRLLRGMTQEGIASDMGLALPTVKTYRNRAFNRLGIHFRSELFALMLPEREVAF